MSEAPIGSFVPSGTNHLATAGGDYYGYDANNKRVYKKENAGAEEFYFFGLNGQRLAAFTQTTVSGNLYLTVTNTHLYFAGKLIRSQGSTVVRDRLGPNRAGGMSYFPYGEEQSATSNNKEKFGTYFRDQTTGFDYADQRYFRAQLGRFLTPDPYEGSARLDNPETWNRYAYTLGDPANFADPNGLDVCSMIDDGQTRDGIKDAETETCRTVKPVFGGGGDIASELRYTSQVVAAVVNAVVSASNAVVSASLGNGNFAGGETPSVSSNITYPEADTPIGDLGQAVLPKVHETTAYLTTPTPYLWWLQNAAITGVGLPIAGGGTGLTTLRNLSSQG